MIYYTKLYNYSYIFVFIGISSIYNKKLDINTSKSSNATSIIYLLSFDLLFKYYPSDDIKLPIL